MIDQNPNATAPLALDRPRYRLAKTNDALALSSSSIAKINRIGDQPPPPAGAKPNNRRRRSPNMTRQIRRPIFKSP
jgi:hypothetical protein